MNRLEGVRGNFVKVILTAAGAAGALEGCGSPATPTPNQTPQPSESPTPSLMATPSTSPEATATPVITASPIPEATATPKLETTATLIAEAKTYAETHSPSLSAIKTLIQEAFTKDPTVATDWTTEENVINIITEAQNGLPGETNQPSILVERQASVDILASQSAKLYKEGHDEFNTIFLDIFAYGASQEKNGTFFSGYTVQELIPRIEFAVKG